MGNHNHAGAKLRVKALRDALVAIVNDAALDPLARRMASDAITADDAAAKVGHYHTTPVEEFHRAYGHPVEIFPTVPTIEQRKLRVRLLAEELTELASAANVALSIKQDPGDGWYLVAAEQERTEDHCDLVECADALGDLRYVVDGGNLIFGFPGDEVLDEIHASNMSKLGADGKPITRADGKTLKGPNYRPPNVAGIIGVAPRKAAG